MAFKLNIKGISAFVILFLCVASYSIAGAPAGEEKGLFVVRFSWDRESYPDNYTVTLNYSKDSKLASFATPKRDNAKKNEPLSLELAPGDYKLISIEFYSYDLMGNKIVISANMTFTVTSGQTTNGGLLFLIRDPDSKRVLILQLDDALGTEWYVSHFQKKYPSSSMSPAWKFIESEKINKLKADYAKSMVNREKLLPRKGTEYIYGPLGILIKLEKDKNGVVTGYKQVETNTYDEVTKVTFSREKLLCGIGAGYYLYGTPEKFDIIPMPDDMESASKVYLIDTDKLLAYDNNINIYYSVGPVISWKKQGEFRVENAPMNPQFHFPYVSFGTDKMYLYTKGPNKFRNLLVSGYDTIFFKRMEVPEELKRITDVIPTPTKLVIGPIMNGLSKGGADIFSKPYNSNTWEHIEAPRGDCNEMIIDRVDENKIEIICGLSKGHRYTSTDGGKTWQEKDK